jgi:AcrR family transcriptional regulator
MATTTVRRRGAEETTADAIERVAIDLFYRNGFQATSLREIAAKVGIQVGSLYNHISSKEDLLFSIMEGVMLDLLEDQRQVIANPDVVRRMGALVYGHVRFHCERSKEVFIGNSELRSLARPRRQRIVVLRGEYEAVFAQELEDGIREGKFIAVDVEMVVFGLIAMGTSVANWYSPRGRLSLEEIANVYTGFTLRGIWNPAAGSLEDYLDGDVST